MESKPGLTEPGVRYFLKEILKKCRKKKYSLYSKLLNISLLLLFIMLLCGLLYYKYKGKLSETEKKARQKKEEIYIIEKIKTIKPKYTQNQNLIITDLPKLESKPKLDSGFDVLHKNYYSI